MENNRFKFDKLYDNFLKDIMQDDTIQTKQVQIIGNKLYNLSSQEKVNSSFIEDSCSEQIMDIVRTNYKDYMDDFCNFVLERKQYNLKSNTSYKLNDIIKQTNINNKQIIREILIKIYNFKKNIGGTAKGKGQFLLPCLFGNVQMIREESGDIKINGKKGEVKTKDGHINGRGLIGNWRDVINSLNNCLIDQKLQNNTSFKDLFLKLNYNNVKNIQQCFKKYFVYVDKINTTLLTKFVNSLVEKNIIEYRNRFLKLNLDYYKSQSGWVYMILFDQNCNFYISENINQIMSKINIQYPSCSNDVKEISKGLKISNINVFS